MKKKKTYHERSKRKNLKIQLVCRFIAKLFPGGAKRGAACLLVAPLPPLSAGCKFKSTVHPLLFTHHWRGGAHTYTPPIIHRPMRRERERERMNGRRNPSIHTAWTKCDEIHWVLMDIENSPLVLNF